MSDLMARLTVSVLLIAAAVAMLLLGKEPTAAVGVLSLVGGFWFGQYADKPSHPA